MRSKSRDEAGASFIVPRGSRRLVAAAVVVLVSVGMVPAYAAAPLSAMARMEAAERLDVSQIASLSRGYSSRGLRLEAAGMIERKLQTGEIRLDEAVPLLEEIVVEQARRDDPETLLAICEPALRRGASTPLLLYSCGTALRLKGRFPESAATLARVDPRSPVYPYALYAIGQVTAEKGDSKAALDVFRRVRATIGDDARYRDLGEKATRAEGGLLLALARPADAAPLFEALRGDGGDPLVRLGSALAGADNVADGAGLPAETMAGRPVRERILLELAQGGLFRARGRYASAVAAFGRAERELDTFVGSATPPATESFPRSTAAESLGAQIDAHRILRREIGAEIPGRDSAKVRSDIVDLLVGLLVADQTLARAAGARAAAPAPGEAAPASAEGIGEVIRRIERVALDGVEVDRLVDDLARMLDTLENMAHPIQRYRLLTQLEKSQSEINAIKERIRLRRQAAIEGVESGGEASVSRFLADLGRFLSELEKIRTAAGEVREVTRRHFNILRRSDDKSAGSAGDGAPVLREALAFDRERLVSLSSAARALEERIRIVAWERKREELRPCRLVIHRQVVDALVAQARALRERRSPDVHRESWTALERASSYLAGDRLSRRDAIDSAIHIGSLLVEGVDRWGPFPDTPAGEPERAAIGAILPVLSAGATGGVRREESLFLSALLKMRLRDRSGDSEARDFLARFPASPLAGHLAIRLGHEARLSGNGAEAESLYRAAAEGRNADASAAGRYMLGWLRFQRGDADGAARELAPIVGDPSFRCGGPRPFEQAALSLAVRAWQELPTERLPTYGPLRARSCGGKLLLVSLGEAEEKRGEALRAAAAHDLLSRNFLSGESAMEYGKRSVENLIRAAKDDEAMSRALQVAETYGPASAWSESQLPAVREKTDAELAEMLKAVSERKFDAGMRSGEQAALGAAAAGIERYFALKGAESPDGDAELKLKWAVASLRSGDRETGTDLLLELVDEQRTDSVGERASVLYAEAMVAGYERKETSADEAEDSVAMLLEDFPSDKASTLADRLAAAFLASGEYARAARTAEVIAADKSAPKPLVHQAILIGAQAAMLANDLPAARRRALDVLQAGEVEPGVRERARNVLDLSCLKEIEARTGAGDWRGAATLLEELAGRYPHAPETPAYYLRAMRSYQRGGDPQGAARTGLVFLEKFPGREEAVDVAGNVGAFLEERKEYARAADLYAGTAERFPKSDRSPGFLFLAGSLTAEHGDANLARKRFSAYRARYSNPRWMTAYAALSAGLLGWKAGDAGTAVRDIEAGLRLVEAGVGQGAPPGLADLAGKGRLAIGEYWANQFRKLKLVLPLEKSFAVKDRYFRKALASFEKAERDVPVDVAVNASLSSGDLLVEFGRAIIASQRPRGIKGDELAQYEDALKVRARTFFERAVNWYAGALDRLEADEGRPDLALSISRRLEETQQMLAGIPRPPEAR